MLNVFAIFAIFATLFASQKSTVEAFVKVVSDGAKSRSLSQLYMAKAIRGGSVVALVTPMTPTNAVDHQKLAELLKWHVNEGTDGVVILGTTGEASMLSTDEKAEVIKTAVTTINGVIPIIVGVGSIKTSEVIESTLQAEKLGADGVLAITPYYIKPPQRALVTHFAAVADSSSLPVILYNCPGRTGVNMSPETIAECSKHPKIIGVKDAVGDVLIRAPLLRSSCKPNFLLYSGEDDAGCDFMRVGGDGVISVTANVAPRSMHTMLEESKKGNKEASDAINSKLMSLHKNLFIESNPIPVKRALNLMGKIGLAIRPPLAQLDSKFDSLIEAALREAGSL